MNHPIDRATFHRLAPEILNQWSGATVIEHARQIGGEAFAWGVAFGLRVEQGRLAGLLTHFRQSIPTVTAGEALARRLVYTVKETRAVLRKAWRESAGIRWQ